jgi:hypothetical protein
MNITECKVGMRVYFGRTHGEKTLGEIVKVNQMKCKVKQLESRGTMRDYKIGTMWTVPPALMSPVGIAAPAVVTACPVAKRHEGLIMRDIMGVYGAFSPENLTCDGEFSRTQVARKAAALRARLKTLFAEIGRTVSEDEAWAKFGTYGK